MSNAMSKARSSTCCEATEEDIQSLRHVADRLPSQVWLALIIGGMERFAFYAVTTPFQNFMQNPIDSEGVPGALGLGQSTATSIFNGFLIFSFVMPVPFAIVSDMYLGRQKTLLISLWLYVAACLIMFVISLPGVLSRSTGIAGLVISMILVGMGVGGVKATQPPHLADQYRPRRPRVIRLANQELVVVTQELTLQYVYNLFHLFANAASISSLASAFLARTKGFWAAFLLAFVSACCPAIILSFLRGKFVQHQADRNSITAIGTLLIRKAKRKGHCGSGSSELSIDINADLNYALRTSRLILSFAIFYLCYNQISNNLVSQAGQMQLGGFPNDGIQAFNGIASILIWPLIQKGLYPFLQRRKISYSPIHRAVTAFIIMGLAMGYTAGVQRFIYNSGPRYTSPRVCDAVKDQVIPNDVSVWIQLPVYFIIALSALFGFVALSEIAYSDAPKSMKALIQSMTQVTQAVGAALGLALSPIATDPYLVKMYASLAVVSGLSALVFLVFYRRYTGIRHL